MAAVSQHKVLYYRTQWSWVSHVGNTGIGPATEVANAHGAGGIYSSTLRLADDTPICITMLPAILCECCHFMLESLPPPKG